MIVSPIRLTQVVLSLLSVNAAAHAASTQRRATTCNGHAELCNRSYGNVSFVGAHDSYAVGTNNLAVNQDQNVTQQLTDGIRLLQVQAHNSNGVIHLCHTSCGLYDGGALSDYMSTVKTWMDSNPNDVVTMLIVNSDNLAPTEFASAYQTAGVDKLSYSPPSSSLPASGWPTLGTLIDSGTRLVTFLSTTADFTSVPYMIDEFSNIWETAFDVTDTTFDCNVNRTATGADTTTQMFLINHFLDQVVLGLPAPDVAHANTTNAVSGVGSLGQQVTTCETDHGRAPNFMLVDFYEYGGGSVFQVAATINGVTYDPSTTIASPKDGSGSSTTSGTAGTASVTTGPNTNAGVGLYNGQALCASLAVAASMALGVLSLV